MRITPNSWGSTELLEYNDCHDPKDGRFGTKSDCGKGDVSDAGRNRAVYGQQVPESTALDVKASEADRLDEALKTHGDSGAAKDTIARALAEDLTDHPGLTALLQDPDWSMGSRYSNATEGIPNPMDLSTSQAYEKYRQGHESGATPDPQSEKVQDDYSVYEQEGGEVDNALSPDDAQSDYDSYREDAEQEANDASYTEARTEALKEFDREGEKIVEDVQASWDGAVEAIDAAKAALPEDPYGGYGDVTGHPLLPGDFGRQSKTGLHDYDQGEILSQWEEHGEDAPFLKDPAFLQRTELTSEDFNSDYVLEGTEFDPNDDDARDKYVEKYTQDYETDYSDVKGFDSWYEDQYGFEPDEYAAKSATKTFDDWYTEQYGVDPSSWQPPGPALDFASWYQRAYTIAPNEWTPSEGADRMKRERNARNVASALVETWASSSSDSSMKSVALQLAAEDHFGLGATYAKTVTYSPGVYADAREFATRHKAILGTFLGTMHANTQAWLVRQGIEPGATHVTLYRGFAARSAQEPGLATMDLKRGAHVDVLLQPISSFSSSYQTAISFASSSNADVPLVMAVRVPIAQILGSARTGLGCLNESEFTVLGGRYPAFVIGTAGNPVTQSEFHQRAAKLQRALAKAMMTDG